MSNKSANSKAPPLWAKESPPTPTSAHIARKLGASGLPSQPYERLSAMCYAWHTSRSECRRLKEDAQCG